MSRRKGGGRQNREACTLVPHNASYLSVSCEVERATWIVINIQSTCVSRIVGLRNSIPIHREGERGSAVRSLPSSFEHENIWRDGLRELLSSVCKLPTGISGNSSSQHQSAPVRRATRSTMGRCSLIWVQVRMSKSTHFAEHNKGAS